MKNCILFLWCLWKPVYKFLICIPISQESQREEGVNKNHPVDRWQFLKQGERASWQQNDVRSGKMMWIWRKEKRGGTKPPTPTPWSFWIRLPGPFTPLLPCGLSLSFSGRIKGRFLLERPGPISLQIYLVCSLHVPNTLYFSIRFLKYITATFTPTGCMGDGLDFRGTQSLMSNPSLLLPGCVTSGSCLISLRVSLSCLTGSADSLQPEGCCGRNQSAPGWGSGKSEVLWNVSYYYTYYNKN